MELPSQAEDMPIPISSTYVGGGHGHGHGHGHMIHHHEHTHPILPSSAPPQVPSNGPMSDDHAPYKKMVRYRECLKNHAASMGGNATDGCGEFMPSGEDGTIEALTCSACNCHRNFHRKEVEGEPSSYDHCFRGRKVFVGHHHKAIMGGHDHAAAMGYHGGALVPARAVPPHHHQMIMSYNNNMGSLPSESDEGEEGGYGGGVVPRPPHMVKKRFRTKFTQEQKEKMLNFAEKVGWKIQKQEEAVVQQFCQEVGVKRRVLKVWMHNNKHNLAKKNQQQSTAQINPV